MIDEALETLYNNSLEQKIALDDLKVSLENLANNMEANNKHLIKRLDALDAAILDIPKL